MAFVDQVFFYVPLILLLATFCAMIWADSNNPIDIFTSLPSLLIPDMEFPRLR